MANNDFYPPGPANVPPEITRLDSAYRLRVVAMIGGLFLFLLLYVLFIVAAGWLANWLLHLQAPNLRGKAMLGFLVAKFGGAFAALLLWVFLFKGLFKRQRVERSAYITLQEKEYPALFAFIRRVCQDTGAPLPHRVYVSPEVNAALVYDTSLLNLLIPPRKDLLIGLGLVNVVNLSEFKAVLAHEFGHFAQRSVGLGSYLYVANRVMHDIVYSRDALDRFVDSWCEQDLRISFPAWGLKAALWVVRLVLAGTYEGLNLLYLSLSRQLEYNADNVAVRVTGSDALIHALARLEFASECLADAAQSLNAAADHGLFTDDLFYHQTQAAHRLRQLRKDERLGLPPDLPEDATVQVQVFQPVDDGVPEHYRSHPTEHMRERNAKRIYVRSPQDDRSPWLLFGNLAKLKAEVTEQFYRHTLGRREDYKPRPATEVQRFIDAEHAESTFDPKYHGFFDDRFIDPGDVQDLPDRPWSREELAAWLSSWPPADLQQQVQAYCDRRAEYSLLQGLQSGEFTLKEKTFPFRDQQYSLKDVDRLLAVVDQELTSDLQAFGRLDRQVFLAHWSLARHLDSSDGRGSAREADLLARYRFHMALQGLLQEVFDEHARLEAVLNLLSRNPNLSQEEFHQVRNALEHIYQTLTVAVDRAKSYATPSLANVPAGTSLHSLIVDRGESAALEWAGDSISGEWLAKLYAQLQGVLNRLRRVHFKSLGGLLACQERLVSEWTSSTRHQGGKASETVASADG